MLFCNSSVTETVERGCSTDLKVLMQWQSSKQETCQVAELVRDAALPAKIAFGTIRLRQYHKMFVKTHIELADAGPCMHWAPEVCRNTTKATKNMLSCVDETSKGCHNELLDMIDARERHLLCSVSRTGRSWVTQCILG